MNQQGPTRANSAHGQSRFAAHTHTAAAFCGLFAFSLVLAATHTIAAAFSALAFGLVVLGVAGLPLRLVAKRLALANVFIVFVWATFPFSMGHTPLEFWVGLPEAFPGFLSGLAVYAEGVEKSLVLTLKVNSLVCLSLALLHTRSIHETAQALYQLRFPPKLVLLLLLTARHIHSLERGYKTVSNAALLRGFTPGLRWRSIKPLAYLVSFVLIKSVDRSEKVMAAMRLRGFCGRFAPPLFSAACPSPWPTLAMSAAATFALWCMEKIG